MGIVIGSSTLTRLGDVYGRKPIYILGMFLHLAFMAGIWFATSGAQITSLCVLFGLSLASRYYVGYTYNVEMQPKSHYVMVSTTMFLFESIAYFAICIYFWKIGRSWRILQIPNIVFMTLGIIVISLFPESPRFLISSRQF